METFAQTQRTTLKRLPKRGIYDRELVYRILDEGFICHVGFNIESQPFVIPTGYARFADKLYIHGSQASRMLRTLSEGIDVCVTVTLVDGLVLARSAFHHSMNYRSVLVFGQATLVDEPAKVTPAQMNRWCRDFDNWAICDTACFHLFDRTPHAWAKVTHWSSSNDEFVKRTAFALLWSLSVHDERTGDEPFIQGLTLIECAASDERNFVKKSANMALRAIGKRNRTLNAAAIAMARRLADSPNSVARWVGRDALRELTSPSVIRRLRPHSLTAGETSC